jgi:hypothetical protein
VTSCSLDSLDAHEPLAGTAPYATAWIVIEQPGPWGRDALADSRLDRDVSAHLATAKGTGVTALLARHPDRPERAGASSRHVWVARSVAGGMLVRHAEVDSVAVIADWDLAEIGRGSLPPFGSVTRDPVTFICTHSGRDLCCAVHGRALVADVTPRLAPKDRAGLWECSHIGGHRFAPVALTLPQGTVHGRLDFESALLVQERARSGGVVVDHLRGRSSLIPPFQSAAIEVQRRWGVEGVDDLDVLRVVDGTARPVALPAPQPGDTGQVEAEVRHVDGRSWRAVVESEPLERDRRESCGKEQIPGGMWVVTEIVTAPSWR